MRIAAIILIVSVILFSYSVYSIESNVSTHRNVSVLPGSASSVSIREDNVQAGNDLEYIIASHNGTDINITSTTADVWALLVMTSVQLPDESATNTFDPWFMLIIERDPL